MIDLYLKLNCGFTETDKEECWPIIYKIIDLANLARREGVLALEVEMEHEQNVLLKIALDLVVDGTDPALVKQILQTSIVAGKYSGSQLLSRLLIAEGALSLQQGENPAIIATKLGAIMGEDYIVRINKEFNEMQNNFSRQYDFLKVIKGQQALTESIQFEEKLLQFDNRTFQVILREIDDSDLLIALKGCSFSLIQKFFENISHRGRLLLLSQWEEIGPVAKEHILNSQKDILEKIMHLEDVVYIK